MKQTVITIGFLLSSVAIVFAADPVVPDPIIAPPVYEAMPLWTGLYIGGQIGWARGKSAPHFPTGASQGDLDGPGEPIDPDDPKEPGKDTCELGDFAWAGASTTNTSALAWADLCRALAGGKTSDAGSWVGVVKRKKASSLMQRSQSQPEQMDMMAVSDDADDVLTYSSGGHRDTFIGGVHVGYNHQFDNNFVIGAVADINFMNWDRYVRASYQQHSAEVSQSMKYLATLRAKVGYAADRVFFYGTGGLALGSIKNEVSLYGVQVDRQRKTRLGYTIGAGVDFRLTEDFSLGAEYLFTDLGNKSKNEVFSDNVRFHSIFVKASYHFN